MYVSRVDLVFRDTFFTLETTLHRRLQTVQVYWQVCRRYDVSPSTLRTSERLVKSGILLLVYLNLWYCSVFDQIVIVDVLKLFTITMIIYMVHEMYVLTKENT